ncbi:hypothetical protein RF11_14246 [Thelohanellus kitauei]|uniref:ISXO2-like transposase domain-containing protein n=1 Tax=Thelohanellus kitauei TaxID=669202 RepID=A0A0C2MHM7_THEKT|nr:hypothetical protein RF11_14246 [Thelohanellus kitauei]
MVLVEDRTAQTLHAVISSCAEPGTTIMTDCWGGYNGLDHLGYIHQRVNHRNKFVSPDDRNVYTQNIEVTWRYLKEVTSTTSEDDDLRILKIAVYVPDKISQ